MSRFRKGDKVDSLAGFRMEKTEPTVPSGLLKAARKSGQLNLSGRGLTEGRSPRLTVLQEVAEMFSFEGFPRSDDQRKHKLLK